ncbi:MAG TPA: ABC transporter permease [Alphaproteobacteria bacterium]|nr:ABC transporter permease [Alphaproteobacteria bacterium]
MIRDLFFRLRALFRGKVVDEELDDELRLHLENEVRKFEQSGLPPDEARRRAQLAFGGLEQIKDDCRQARGVSLIDTTARDVRYALRMLRKSPGFTAVVVLTLALGIGANTAVFTLMHAVLGKTLPVNDPSGLVVVGDPTLVHLRASGSPPRVDIFSYPLYTNFRDSNSVFSGMLASGQVNRVRVSRVGETNTGSISDQTLGTLVSGNYFSVLGVGTYLGRPLTPEDDDVPDAHPVAVVSYGFWKEKLGADANIIGQTFLFNGYPFTVVGVAQPDFLGDTVGDREDVWFPVTMQAELLPGRTWLKQYEASWLHLIARLKPGVSTAQAQAQLNLLFQQQVDGALLNRTQGSDARGFDRASLKKLKVEVSPGGRGFSQLRGRYQEPLWLLMGIVGLVLLITCVNVANLLMARALGRQREISVRLALGASPLRIVRQLLVESFQLAFVGGALGLLVAYWGVGVLLQMTRAGDFEAHLDLPILLFAFAVSLVTGLLFGLAPALRMLDSAIVSGLKSRSEGQSGLGTSGRLPWGKVLIVGQVALSVWVLFAAGLFVRSMQKLRQVDLGYNEDKLVIVRVDPITGGFKTFAQRVQLADQMAARLSGLPGVRAVTFSKNGLFGGADSSDDIKIDGYIPAKPDDLEAPAERVGPNYFSMLHIPIISGREIDGNDSDVSNKVMVINTALAHFYFGNANPLGKRIWAEDDDNRWTAFEIVGIAGDARDHTLRGKVPRRLYLPLRQSNDNTGEISFILKATGNPEPLVQLARKEIRSYSPTLPILGTSTLVDRVSESINSEIMIAKLAGFFGVIALILACMGLYGVMSYNVAGKVKAIGVRMALGARRNQVLWMVLRETLFLTGFSILIGLPVALTSAQLLRSMLFGLAPADPVTLSVALLGIVLVALAAGYIPARRAASIDPIIALRNE